MDKMKKYVYLQSAEEMKELLDKIRGKGVVRFYSYDERKAGEDLRMMTFIDDRMVEVEITTRFADKDHKAVTYVFRKDGVFGQFINPAVAYTTLQHYYKAPDMKGFKINGLEMEITEKGSFANSAAPIVGFNKKFDNAEHVMWVYDLNSAYAASMCCPIPDTEHPITTDGGFVKAGQVGFLDDPKCTMVTEGYADVIFPLMESPYKKFAEKYYKMKKNAKNPAEKAKAKQMLVYAVGFLQRHNPFIRACIVHRCNKYIRARIDENTAMWNTDAIYSLVPRTDLKMGDGIGQFKLEHDGVLIRHKQCNYQIGEEVTYRGVPKSWFDKADGWNILTDEVPQEGNVYEINHETLELEEINYEI